MKKTTHVCIFTWKLLCAPHFASLKPCARVFRKFIHGTSVYESLKYFTFTWFHTRETMCKYYCRKLIRQTFIFNSCIFWGACSKCMILTSWSFVSGLLRVVNVAHVGIITTFANKTRKLCLQFTPLNIINNQSQIVLPIHLSFLYT